MCEDCNSDHRDREWRRNPEAGAFSAQALRCDDVVALQREFGLPGGGLEMDPDHERVRDRSASLAPAQVGAR